MKKLVDAVRYVQILSSKLDEFEDIHNLGLFNDYTNMQYIKDFLIKLDLLACSKVEPFLDVNEEVKKEFNLYKNKLGFFLQKINSGIAFKELEAGLKLVDETKCNLKWEALDG